MEGHNSAEQPVCLRKLHDDKLSRIQELKGKKEAMLLELEKKTSQNPDSKIKDFEDLRGKYSSKREKLLATLPQK